MLRMKNKKVIWVIGTLLFIGIFLNQYYKAPSLDIDQVAVTTLDGTNMVVSQLKGKPIVVNYWATWCPPCLKEFPHFEKVKQDVENQVHFIMISDESIETITRFSASKPYTFTYLKSVQPFSELGIHSRPSTLIYNANGDLIHTITGMIEEEELNHLLEEIL
jgi:thiol-disulfide isomerase/thioredoxin